jgi:hypothetical protein
LHGIIRTVWLARKLGKERAIKVSVVSGTALAFLVCYILVPGIGLQGPRQHLILGAVLAAFMATFDIAFGKLVMRFSWQRVLRDFNPRSGNYLSFGLAAPARVKIVVASVTQPSAEYGVPQRSC